METAVQSMELRCHYCCASAPTPVDVLQLEDADSGQPSRTWTKLPEGWSVLLHPPTCKGSAFIFAQCPGCFAELAQDIADVCVPEGDA
jgi:hypothetical protein